MSIYELLFKNKLKPNTVLKLIIYLVFSLISKMDQAKNFWSKYN